MKTSRMPAFVLCILNGVSMVPAQPFPLAVPEDISPYWGDPEQVPVQGARFRESHPMIETEITWPINQGNPFADWGHFRLSRNMLHGDPSQALRVQPDNKREDRDRWVELFENRPWKDGEHLRVSVLSPPEGMTQAPGGWPVVFLFPGSGGVGREQIRRDRLQSEMLWATPWYREHMPAYVVVFHPNSRPFSYLDGGKIGLNLSPVWDAYLEVVDHFAARPDVDRSRISAMGHSMGGTSVWQLMLARPGLLAAAVANAGQPPADSADYRHLSDTPLLMIQGHDDTWVGSSSYLWAYKQLLDAGHPRVRFWEIQNIGHSGGSMNLTVIHQWMHSQRARR